MIRRQILAAAFAPALMMISTAPAADEEKLTSGLAVGKKVGTYKSTKIAGADDGVKVDSSLCYTWRLKGRPVAFVFARKASEPLAGLVEKLEKVAASDEAKQMQVVVNFIGLEADAVKDFAKEKELKHVVFTAVDEQNAARLAIAEKAEFTVMQYVDKTVAANHAAAAGKLDDDLVEKIVKSSEKLLADAPIPTAKKKNAKPKKKKKDKKRTQPEQKQQKEA